MTIDSARAMVAEAGLRPEEESVRVIDPWRRSAFLRLAPAAAGARRP
ncbi:MAG: hypothetical protein IPK56_03075 [Elusimicrobia bacterium]|nr:hypothetical protein [Elusimicrobiota bacterium]